MLQPHSNLCIVNAYRDPGTVGIGGLYRTTNIFYEAVVGLTVELHFQVLPVRCQVLLCDVSSFTLLCRTENPTSSLSSCTIEPDNSKDPALVPSAGAGIIHLAGNTSLRMALGALQSYVLRK